MARNPYYDPDNKQTQNGGRKPRYDYDSDEFYDAIEQLARTGARDREIAVGLKSYIGFSLRPETFNDMKCGRYKGWTPEDNARRSLRMSLVLADARDDINRIVKAMYLSAALGKQKVKSKVTVTRRLRINGELTDNEEVQTTETEAGMAPNMQALGTWLYHHDPEWRKIQKGVETDPTTAPNPDNVVQGVDVSSWIDRELMGKNEEKTAVETEKEDNADNGEASSEAAESNER